MTDQYLQIPIGKDAHGRVRMEGIDAAFSRLESQIGEPFGSAEFAAGLDKLDTLSHLRSEFIVPAKVYFVGNSLGAQPRSAFECVGEVLSSWSDRGVAGHFSGARPWLNYDEEFLVEGQAALVGALPSEVALMNSLTVNLHLLLTRFYQPKIDGRRKILIEEKAFPSDFYAIQSQISLHGFDPAECIVLVTAREGEDTIRTEDLVENISEIGSELALLVMGGVHYYTGQLFDIPTITAAVHAVGGKTIWDLAHAVGNVDLCLHDWGVDAAVWCTYKYLCSGPGGIGGFFIHESHFNQSGAPRLAGWWSHNVASRFEMNPHKYEPGLGASEFRISNVPILTAASLLASLQVFAKTDMRRLRAKSIVLTAFLEKMLPQSNFKIITPSDPHARGSQLSLLFDCDTRAKEITQKLEHLNVIVDYRKPGLVRVAPTAMYSSFGEVHLFVKALADVTNA